MDRQALGHLNHLLSEADLVKFAKLRPPVDQARALLMHARAFVDATKPVRTEVEVTAGQPLAQ
jgi:hypothetical protein